ncbi:hypothetical protein C8F01DRAFT_1329737 [Mycena amicta]|nr:hypothetical protein C8F01DRAFT_1329737 [Mycena amicta]
MFSKNLSIHGRAAVARLLHVSENANAPYLRPIAGATSLLLDAILNINKHKTEWIDVAEKVTTVIDALAEMSDNEADVPNSVLLSLSAFAETLQRLLIIARQQASKGLLSRVVRFLDERKTLNECKMALAQSLQIFKLQSDSTLLGYATKLKGEFREQGYELRTHLLSLRDSSTSLSTAHSSTYSLLPGLPKIFYGRDKELETLVHMLLLSDTSRTVILGSGGIGKSALALAALYDTAVVEKFQAQRHFISCEAAHGVDDIIAALFHSFALDDQGNTGPQKAVMGWLTAHNLPRVIVLDNLETAWDSDNAGQRASVEDFLSRLSEISNLHLLATLRGEERPANVRWTRPFLPPLAPLSPSAAKLVLEDIAGGIENDNQIDRLLKLTDCLPLAITLLASLVSFEGAESVLERWDAEGTSLLSEGVHKNSNLGQSIALSLSSPRFTAVPGALTLLCMLAVLPAGVAESTLAEMNLPLDDIARSRLTVYRTSLAYMEHGRLKVLAPIREYLRSAYPLPAIAVKSLQDYYYNLVHLFRATWSHTLGNGLIARLSSDLGNIRSLLRIALATEVPLSLGAISCIIELSAFTRVSAMGSQDMLVSIEAAVIKRDDPSLSGQYFLAICKMNSRTVPVELYARRAINCFQDANDIKQQAEAYHQLAFRQVIGGQTKEGLESAKIALTLAHEAQDDELLARVYYITQGIYYTLGDLRTAWIHTLHSIAHAQAAGNLSLEIEALRAKAVLLLNSGSYSRALEALDRLDPLMTGLGLNNSSSDFRTLLLRAIIHLHKTEFQEAKIICLEVVSRIEKSESAKQLKEEAYYANICLRLLRADFEMGNKVSIQEIEHLRMLRKSAAWEVNCDLLIADILQTSLKDLDSAKVLLDSCLQRSIDGPLAETINGSFQRLSDNALARDQVWDAFRYAMLHLAMSSRLLDFQGMHQAMKRMGVVLLRQKEDETAGMVLKLAMEGFEAMGVHRAHTECREHTKMGASQSRVVVQLV